MFKHCSRYEEIHQRIQINGEACISSRLERELCLEVLLAPLENLLLH